MGRMQRNKGKAWEQTVARAFREVYGERVRRGWQAREGDDAPDIEGAGEWWVECKHHHVVNHLAALRQAEEAIARAGSALRAVAVCKNDRSEPVAVLRFETFLALVRELEGLRAGRAANISNQAHLDSVDDGGLDARS